MGATANGLPYPTEDDYVIDGDDAIAALAEAADDGIWSPWVDAATAFGGVTLGNGSAKIRARVHGTTCEVQGALMLGSTSDVTGQITASIAGLGLSMSGALATVGSIEVPVGVAWAYDSSATSRVAGTAMMSPGGTSIFFRRQAVGEGAWGFPDTVPFTWAQGDYLTFTAVFELD